MGNRHPDRSNAVSSRCVAEGSAFACRLFPPLHPRSVISTEGGALCRRSGETRFSTHTVSRPKINLPKWRKFRRRFASASSHLFTTTCPRLPRKKPRFAHHFSQKPQQKPQTTTQKKSAQKTMAPGSFCDLRGLQVLQTARKPNSVLDDHSSRRPITEPLQQPTRRFWLPANRVSPPWRIGPIRFLPPGEERQDPCLFGLAPCGVYPAASITGRAVRSYRTFSPLPLSFARLGRYVLCCTCRPDGLNHPSRTLSGTLPCGVRTFLPRSTPRGPSGSDHPAVCSFKCIAAPI